MPTPTKGHRLGGSPAHQRHMMANLATALFEHGKITTTEARARRLRPLAERLITFAKRGDLHARRQVLTVVTDKTVVHNLFAEIGPSFASRDGRLHPDHQGGAAQGRQRRARGDRAGARGGGAEDAPPPRSPGSGHRARIRPAGRGQAAAAGTAAADEAATEAAVTDEAPESVDAQAADAEVAVTRPSRPRLKPRRPPRRRTRTAQRRTPATSRQPTNSQAARDEPGRSQPAGLVCAGPEAPAEQAHGDLAQLAADPPLRLRLDLRYDGSAFHGWARQPGRATVQQTVEEALWRVLRLARAAVAHGGRPDRRRRPRARPGGARRRSR